MKSHPPLPFRAAATAFFASTRAGLRGAAVFLLAATLCFQASAQQAATQPAATPDDTAKFLAGLPIRGTSLDEFSHDPAWAEHATEFDKAWSALEVRQLAKIRLWGPEFLSETYSSKSPLFYFFSGPDILYAQMFFPNASTYVLAGLEPIGAVPDIAHLPKGALAPGLANLRKSLNAVLSFSFFITKDMKVDLQQNQLSGTLPVLYVFLARAGCRIEKVELIAIDKDGVETSGKASAHGAKITFLGTDGAEQTLYYFDTNLANDGIKANPGFIKFCEKIGQGRSFVKAASYLMHTEEFSASRDFLLAHSTAILQDDSGIPVKYFEPSKWLVRYFGVYHGPIDIFKQYNQPEMAAAYKTSNPPPLSFGIGYGWRPWESSLILATPK